jgi:hypothetical protein
MEPERLVQDALEHAGDPAGAFLWRRVCRDLDGGLVVGVAARDGDLADRLVRRVPAQSVELAPLRLEERDDTLRPTLGSIDRMLGAHAMVWATPASAALTGEERAGLRAMLRAGAPDRRAIVITDLDLLERMSDAPRDELADVIDRVRMLAGPSFDVLVDRELPDWIERARADRVTLASERRRAVAEVLLRDARRRATDAVAHAEAELGRVDALLRAEDQALEAERRDGRRAAGHLLAAMRRHTEQLLVDLRDFLVVLERDVPAQIEAVPDLATVRRTVPHWLQHVVSAWMEDRLAAWRAAVLLDLEDLRLDAAALDRAELLVPALHPQPVRTEDGWGQRLGVTAAVGGGAALLLLRLWIPGLLAVSGGIAWRALGRSAAEARTRRALVDAAIAAVRKMSEDGERLLRDQIRAMEQEIEHLGDDGATDRSTARTQLERELESRQQRKAQLDEALAELDRRITTIQS